MTGFTVCISLRFLAFLPFLGHSAFELIDLLQSGVELLLHLSQGLTFDALIKDRSIFCARTIDRSSARYPRVQTGVGPELARQD